MVVLGSVKVFEANFHTVESVVGTRRIGGDRKYTLVVAECDEVRVHSTWQCWYLASSPKFAGLAIRYLNTAVQLVIRSAGALCELVQARYFDSLRELSIGALVNHNSQYESTNVA